MNFRPLVAAGTLMGIGMGGFVDGILFHQILQLHSMLSARYPQDILVNVKTSMVWDGLFHSFTWITVAIALKLLWDALTDANVPKSGTAFWGALLLGWGIFNLVEGLIDHHILGIHHVVERLDLSVYDYLFLLSGVVFIIVGVVVIRTVKKDTDNSHNGFEGSR